MFGHHCPISLLVPLSFANPQDSGLLLESTDLTPVLLDSYNECKEINMFTDQFAKPRS